jgi:mRNA interferase RelE/StbE
LAWQIEFDSAAKKELERIDRQAARRIIAFLRERVAPASDPRAFGQALKGERFGEFWKYRVGDYRIIARIEDRRFVVLVLRIGHRSRVYKGR